MTTSMTPDLGRFLFAFAIVADTHMNEDEDSSASPFPAMKLANARTRHALQAVDRLDLAFVVHLGDMINPVPALATYAPAAERFKELARGLRHPLHLVPGNHDVGDKPVDWMPAASVNDAAIALYERHFGRHFHSFDMEGCHFIVLNASLLNSGLAAEAEQRDWLERDLAANRGRRIFVFIHYPPYIGAPDEAGTYDNLDEPGRSWLMDLVARAGVEALFAGHVHNLFYNRHGPTECYVLPSVTFVRHDYSEFGRIGPGDENGRNDAAKLGWAVVRVHERGHVLRIVRSGGATLAPGERLPEPRPRLEPSHSKEPHAAPVGMDLRHPWAEIVEVPATGALDEFARKRARNDYPLYALWEMGVRKLRVPLQDLADPRVCARMRDLRAIGHEFTVYSYGVPQDGPARAALVEHADLVDVWEVAILETEFAAGLRAVAALKAQASLRAFLSRLHAHPAPPPGARSFRHAIDHGFLPEDGGQIAALLDDPAARGAIDGLVFRIGRETAPAEALPAIRRIAAAAGKRAAMHVRLAGAHLAENATDDLANASRVAEACAAALAVNDVDLFFDTFLDVDRGYYVRHGFLDRRHNPRLASFVYRHTHAALDADAGRMTIGAAESFAGGRLLLLDAPARACALVLPEAPLPARSAPLPSAFSAAAAEWIDLASGAIAQAGAAGEMIQAPVLVRIERN